MDMNIFGSSVGNAVQNTSGATTPPPVSTSGHVAEHSPTPQVTSLKSLEGVSEDPTLEQVREAVDKINVSLKENSFEQNVQFAVDPSSKRVVVQVIELQTQKVIRQIPTEEVIQMSKVLGQKLGQVISQKA